MAEPATSPLENLNDAADTRRFAAAEADIAAGRVVSHEAVKRWLLSWGTANELPRPKCGE